MSSDVNTGRKLHACVFVGLDAGETRLSDETTILRFRRLLQAHDLAPQMLVTVDAQLVERGVALRAGTVVDATLIAAPSSAKNASGERDPKMHQTKKGNQWHFGMKAHVDAESGLEHTMIGAAANVNDVTQVYGLLYGAEIVAISDADYHGEAKPPGRTSDTLWITAVRPGLRRALDKDDAVGARRSARAPDREYSRQSRTSVSRDQSSARLVM